MPEDDNQHDFDLFFDQIDEISVMNNIVFVATEHQMDHFITLTGYFAHSMIMLANSDFTVTPYYRPRLFEGRLEVLSGHLDANLDEIGEFDHIATDFHGHTIRAVGFNFKPYFVPDFDNPVSFLMDIKLKTYLHFNIIFHNVDINYNHRRTMQGSNTKSPQPSSSH